MNIQMNRDEETPRENRFLYRRVRDLERERDYERGREAGRCENCLNLLGLYLCCGLLFRG